MRAVRNGTDGPKPTAVEMRTSIIKFIHRHFCFFQIQGLDPGDPAKRFQRRQDLYVSLPRGDNKWSAPVNLGALVNSGQADFAPFLSADGRRYFFPRTGPEDLADVIFIALLV